MKQSNVSAVYNRNLVVDQAEGTKKKTKQYCCWIIRYYKKKTLM